MFLKKKEHKNRLSGECNFIRTALKIEIHIYFGLNNDPTAISFPNFFFNTRFLYFVVVNIYLT